MLKILAAVTIMIAGAVSLIFAAMKFYEKCGMKPQKIGVETIL